MGDLIKTILTLICMGMGIIIAIQLITDILPTEDESYDKTGSKTPYRPRAGDNYRQR